MKYKIVLIFFVLFGFSCKKDMSSRSMADEQQQIDNYLQLHLISIKPTASGLYFESTQEGDGESPSIDDFVNINYSATTLDDRLIETNNTTDARNNGIIASSSIAGPVKLYIKNITIKGLIEGLLKMQEGGKAWMLMPSSITFNDYIPRIYKVELVKVIHDPVAYENEKIINYLDTLSNRLTVAKPTLADTTSDGLYYIETLAGTGSYPKDGEQVNVSYTVNLIDGPQIISNANFTFRIGDSSIAPDFSAGPGVKKMKKGGKALIIVPYSKAYGIKGLSIDGVIKVPMYATLVYSIELKSITP
jgi:FKBP-type peptidyl-prolyl cis-trans isomerase